MYEFSRDRIDELKVRFDEAVESRSAEVEPMAKEYLEALTEFIDAYNHGPGADPRLVALDTTGQLARTEEAVAWAEDERRRVRAAVLS